MADTVTPATLLRMAGRIIQRYGWIQGGIGDPQTGFCMYGAVLEAGNLTGVELNWQSTPLREADFALREVSNSIGTVWNDDPERTEDEVLDAIKRAAEFAEGKAK